MAPKFTAGTGTGSRGLGYGKRSGGRGGTGSTSTCNIRVLIPEKRKKRDGRLRRANRRQTRAVQTDGAVVSMLASVPVPVVVGGIYQVV